MSNEFRESAGGLSVTPHALPTSSSTTYSSASFADLKDKVSEDISAASETIRSGADSAIDKVKEVATEQTSFAARRVGGVAKALEKVGAELEGSEQAEVGRYARQIGQSVQSFARQMEGKDLGEIANMAEDFGRRQPLAFLGIAALAGLAASRFLTASAERPRETLGAAGSNNPPPSANAGGTEL
ncbi:nutrient deprivation-induced protein [Rhizobium hidalgonense]|uniref:Nutrient deprivation-induced protein n=1 Tax=Rhizobium hidalgonense TaxID=1538159 RepID=A0A2A6K9X2_9HYPH|nr:nutrient deprivation-induced protein [Rhizobium hidalgonense]MDR9777323.1 nutrient deprivation-induced protein [Rhizobium hidalgonense]MDR9814939.1 nutrient deprivation-induced protein [Rhizobium hidalgonense]MDR9823583.1 nutrient deprivation-induced protein [Rhizobium hidalgonense]PDT21330.1 nutrient deprivation-induced protein [Rhizobium hidalgonense]PON07986.1 nutrient deprivation-induced protein [Rhizobium hidalgonense]